MLIGPPGKGVYVIGPGGHFRIQRAGFVIIKYLIRLSVAAGPTVSRPLKPKCLNMF